MTFPGLLSCLCTVSLWLACKATTTDLQDCGVVPHVENGQSEAIHVPVSTLRHSCVEGYRLVGSPLLSCVNGSWWPDVPKCVKIQKHHCDPPPEIPHAKFQFASLEEGVQVTYRCVPGYKMLGQDQGKLVCSQGQWQGPQPTCEARSSCGHPGYIDNGRWRLELPGLVASSHQDSTTSDLFEVGSLLVYSCAKGYKLEGRDVLECRPSQIWSHSPPLCIPEMEPNWFCPRLPPLRNGFCKCLGQDSTDLDLCRPFQRGTQLDCQCLQGFAREGSGHLSCIHNTSLDRGAWDRLMPMCTKAFAPSDSEYDSMPDDIQSGSGTNYNSGAISDGKNKVSTLVIVVTTACSVFGVLLIIMVLVIFQRKKPRAALFQQGAPAPPYARVHNNSMDEHDRLALMAYAEASRLHLPSYEEAMRPSPAMVGPPGLAPVPPTEYSRLPPVHPAVRAANLQLQQAMAGDGNNNINNNNNNNSGGGTNRHSTVTTSTMNRDGVSDTFGSVDTVNVSMSDASTSVTVETYDSGTSTRSMSSQRATAGSLHSSDDQLATDNAPLLDTNVQREMDVVSVSSSRISKDE